MSTRTRTIIKAVARESKRSGVRHPNNRKIAKSESKKKKLPPADAVAVVKAFGGYALICSRRFKIGYATDLMAPLPIISSGRLQHDELTALVAEAFASADRVTRTYQLHSLGLLNDVVAHAAPLGKRWALLTITDRTQEVRAATIQKDLVSNLGHELRTPTTAVALIAQALQEASQQPEQVVQFAERLDHVAQRLYRLTESMIVLAKAQQDIDEASRTHLEINEVVDEAMRRLLEVAASRQVKIRHVKRNPGTVYGDFDALVTAVENLLSNAVNYSPAGSKVFVTTRVDLTEGQVVLSVIDQGIGIDQSSQERVFDRFYRTDEARNQRAGGAGLGLAIVKNTVQAHDGAVSVVSKPQVGSTFTMTLPLADLSAATAKAKDKYA